MDKECPGCKNFEKLISRGDVYKATKYNEYEVKMKMVYTEAINTSKSEVFIKL